MSSWVCRMWGIPCENATLLFSGSSCGWRGPRLILPALPVPVSPASAALLSPCLDDRHTPLHWLLPSNFKLPPASSATGTCCMCCVLCVFVCPVGGLCVGQVHDAPHPVCTCPGVCVLRTPGADLWVYGLAVLETHAVRTICKHTASTCMCFVCAAMCPCSLWSRGHSCSTQNPPVYSYTYTCFMKLWLPRAHPCACITPAAVRTPAVR
jgi:hypothetical protein